MTITSMDQLVAAAATSQKLRFHRATAFNADGIFLTNGAMYYPRDGSSARVRGFPGISPLSAYTRESVLAITGGPSPTPAGHSIIPMNNPTAPNKLYVGALSVTANQPGLFMLVDVICAYRMASTSASPITPTAFGVPASGPRNYNGGVGCEAWIDQTNQMFAGDMTITYTNSDNVGSRTSVGAPWQLTSSGDHNVLQRINLAAGDRGVRSVQQVAWTGGGGGGNGGMGVVLIKPILTVGVKPEGQTFDFTQLGLPEVAEGAALQTLFQPSSTSVPIVYSGDITLYEG
jgi:hypothetical protein